MKRAVRVLIPILLLFALLTIPAFAAEDVAPEADQSELLYLNATNLSGQLVRSFQFAPRKSLLSEDGFNENPTVALYLDEAAKNLNEILSPQGYRVVYQKGVLSATIVFDSVTDFYISIGEDGFSYEEPDGEESKGFFFTEYKTKTKTVWEYADDADTIPGVFQSIAAAIGETKENIVYRYVYGTKFRPEAIWSDADVVSYADGLYYHEFIMDANSLDREIELTQKNPNPTGWYVIAILAGAAVAAGFTAFILIRRKKERS